MLSNDDEENTTEAFIHITFTVKTRPLVVRHKTTLMSQSLIALLKEVI